MEHRAGVELGQVQSRPRCACGEFARPGQRNCRRCHADAEKRRRVRLRLQLERLQTALDRVTEDFPETRAAFESSFRSRAVNVPRDGDGGDITGIVVGFLPNLMLRILDDSGRTEVFPLAQVRPDRGRKVTDYGSITSIHPANP